jgi:hypothetical protein
MPKRWRFGRFATSLISRAHLVVSLRRDGALNPGTFCITRISQEIQHDPHPYPGHTRDTTYGERE